jgi:two-component system sensor histidine kinase UhpB
LKIHCELLAKRTGMNIRMMPTDITFLAHRETEIALFRIAQEALNNSIRHSKATNVTVKLVSDRTRWVLSVIDDGVGIPHGRRLAQATPGKSFGLISMRERAEAAGGRLRVISAPGQGTQIVVAWLKEGV